MKFVSIHSDLTAGPGNVALHVDPPIDAEVFARMKALAGHRGFPVWIGVAANGLVTVEHSDRHAGVVTAETLKQLEQLYLEAGDLVEADNKARQDKHAALVQQASQSTGLPVDTVAL